MVTKETLETKLAAMRKQQQEEARQALMLEGAAQFCAMLLKELTPDTPQDTPHD